MTDASQRALAAFLARYVGNRTYQSIGAIEGVSAIRARQLAMHGAKLYRAALTRLGDYEAARGVEL